MKTKLFFPLLFGLLAGSAFHAVAQSMADQATAGRFRQGEIQVSSHALVAELDAMIDEYDRNGLHGNDINSLKNLRGILSRMSEKDMAKILSLLDQAGAQSNPASALKVIAAAYSQQKGVVVQMKQILTSYESDEEALDLAKSVSDLADRQAANLRTGIESAQWAVDNHDDDALAASLEAQAAEQKALDDEMQLLQTKIANFAKDPDNAALAPRFNQGVQEGEKLAPFLGAATDSLNQKKLFAAVTSEKSARDSLRHLARTLSPPQDDVDALQAAMDELERIISQQKDLILTTHEALPMSIQDFITGEFKVPQGHSSLHDDAIRNGWVSWPLDKVAQQKEAQDLYYNYKASKIDGNGLENQEGDLANQTDSLGQDLESIAKPAADALNSAVPQMQAARSTLNDKDATGAMQSENVALGDMEMALAALQQQLAAAERAEQNAGDPIADLQQLQTETQALIQSQTTVDQNTAAAATPEQTATNAQQQGDLQQKAQQIQQQAAAAAPAAAQSLAAAAGNMQQAAGAMTSPASPASASQAAQAPQAQAMQNLKNASDQLGQQINQLQQDQQQMADAQKYLDQVEKLIEAEQKLQGDTKQTEPQQKKQLAAIQALAPRQQTTQGDTNDLQKALAADATLPDADAMAALASSASAHMGAAHGQLATGDATSADPQEGKALDDLYALKNSLQAQIQADQSQLGADADADANADQSNNDAAAAVAQAQAQVGQAMNAMAAGASQSAPQAQAADQQAAGEMNQAASTVGNADAQAAPLPAGAQQAMQAAAADASQAAADAAAGQNAQAQAAGQQAQAALGQAAAALAQAQAGIAAAGSPGDDPGSPGPGNEPGPPGSTPGPPGPGTGPPGPGTGHGHGNTQITNGAQSTHGSLAGSHAKFLSLPERDRATIQQSQAEKYPQQYAGKVEQYLENLANDNASQ